MPAQALPETTLDPELAGEVDAIARGFASVADAEIAALTRDLLAPLTSNDRWLALSEVLASTIRNRGYIVVRGLTADCGRSLLIVSAALGAFNTYAPQRIVKRFRMSPWTSELSHTSRAGEFHTDGNVSPVPPAWTAMQCETEDPGGPEYAEQRVAHLPDLLERLASGDGEDIETLAFLTEADAVMAHERSSEVWTGRLVQGGTIRYHPHSLRIASRRLDQPFPKLESAIAAIHRAALGVSVPFHTGPGDTVLVSNRAALHYRGACSVRFTRFPTEFDSRSLFVLHLNG